jgi:hypothetical protein
MDRDKDGASGRPKAAWRRWLQQHVYDLWFFRQLFLMPNRSPQRVSLTEDAELQRQVGEIEKTIQRQQGKNRKCC